MQSFLAKSLDTESFVILKHVPHAFEWKQLDPNQICSEKKKNKTIEFKLSEILDLKHQPILLKDGDHIAIACEPEGDDFQTDDDAQMRHEFALRKAEEARENELQKQKKGKGEASVVINLD